jgi:hypothetical protein
MNRPTSISFLAASLLAAASAGAIALQRTAQQENYVETGREFRQAERVTMGDNLLTPEEERRFSELRRQAKGRQDIDRIEAEERALLNQRVAERIAAALNQPAGPGPERNPSSAERPASGADRLQSPEDPGATQGSMGR